MPHNTYRKNKFIRRRHSAKCLSNKWGGGKRMLLRKNGSRKRALQQRCRRTNVSRQLKRIGGTSLEEDINSISLSNICSKLIKYYSNQFNIFAKPDTVAHALGVLTIFYFVNNDLKNVLKKKQNKTLSMQSYIKMCENKEEKNKSVERNITQAAAAPIVKDLLSYCRSFVITYQNQQKTRHIFDEEYANKGFDVLSRLDNEIIKKNTKLYELYKELHDKVLKIDEKSDKMDNFVTLKFDIL